MIDTSLWSSCSRWSPWSPCSGHTISSTFYLHLQGRVYHRFGIFFLNFHCWFDSYIGKSNNLLGLLCLDFLLLVLHLLLSQESKLTNTIFINQRLLIFFKVMFPLPIELMAQLKKGGKVVRFPSVEVIFLIFREN